MNLNYRNYHRPLICEGAAVKDILGIENQNWYYLDTLLATPIPMPIQCSAPVDEAYWQWYK
jgi:hypothetical protein